MTVIPTREHVPQAIRGPLAAVQRPAGLPTAAAAGFTGKDIIRILRRRKWMIIVSIGICLVASAITTLLWGMYAPFYTAKAYVAVNTPRSTELYANPAFELAPTDIIQRLTNSNARMVKSDVVLNTAAESKKVRNTGWYQRDPDTAVRRLTREINVSPVANTNLIEVSMTGTNTGEPPEIVNAVVEAFVDNSQTTASSESIARINRLETQRTGLTNRLAQIAQSMATARQSNLSDIQSQRNIINAQIAFWLPQREQYDQSLKLAADTYDALLQQQKDGTLAKSGQVLDEVDRDLTLHQLKASQINLETERANLLQKFGPQHRSVQAVDNRLNSVIAQIDDLQKQLTQQAMVTTVARQAGLIAELKARDIQATTQIQGLVAKLNDLTSIVAQLENLTTEQQVLEQQARKIDDSLLDLRLVTGAGREGGQRPVYVRQPAGKPLEPSMPKWNVNIPLGLMLGLFIGVGLAFLLEFIDTTIKGPSDIARKVDLPLLGMVPHTDDLEEEIADLRLAFKTHPHSLINEAFRQIRTCLLFSGPAELRRSLLITSPLPEDGRGTVTMNLAGSIARGGKKVLVVDANFRQPMIRKLYPQCPEGGLSGSLVGQANWREQICQVEPNLFVMASGPLPPNPAELLGSEPMRQLVKDMIAEYDQVMFDGAPCLVVTDSAILATMVDGVVLVVRAEANTYGIAQRTRDMLNRVGARILGVVLNGVRVTAGGYLRKSYETFYEYQEQAQLPQGPSKEQAGQEPKAQAQVGERTADREE